jgi:hypothetical protein
MDEKTSEELAVSFLLDATDELIVETLDSGAALKVAELMTEEIAVLDDVGKGSFPVCLDPPEPPQADRVAHSKLVVTRFIFMGGSHTGLDIRRSVALFIVVAVNLGCC